MTYWPQTLSPFLDVRLPGSGDVAMNYHPWTNWGWSAEGAGNPDMDQEIFTTVALPGRQLGRLTDMVSILIAIAEGTDEGLDKRKPDRAEAIKEFKEMAEKIQARKKEIAESAESAAEKALARLKQTDHKAFNRLIGKEYESVISDKGVGDKPQ